MKPTPPGKLNPLEVRPAPPPEPQGEQRFQDALDQDRAFRMLAGAALAIAFVAGTGFGQLPLRAGWLIAVFWLITAAGLVARWVMPRATLLESGWLLLVTRLGALAWLAAQIAVERPALAHGFVLVIGLGALAVMEAATLRRRSLLALIAVAVTLHLAPAPRAIAELHAPLWPHFLAIAAEFALLVAAGYRFWLAGLARLPLVTYRVYPYCIVPLRERGWDHPAKINVS